MRRILRSGCIALLLNAIIMSNGLAEDGYVKEQADVRISAEAAKKAEEAAKRAEEAAKRAEEAAERAQQSPPQPRPQVK